MFMSFTSSDRATRLEIADPNGCFSYKFLSIKLRLRKHPYRVNQGKVNSETQQTLEFSTIVFAIRSL